MIYQVCFLLHVCYARSNVTFKDIATEIYGLDYTQDFQCLLTITNR